MKAAPDGLRQEFERRTSGELPAGWRDAIVAVAQPNRVQAGGRNAVLDRRDDDIDRVERALMKRAEGYEHKESHYPPDVHAIKFFLSNKRSQDWREKTAVEHSGHLTLADLLTDPKTVTPPTKENEK